MWVGLWVLAIGPGIEYDREKCAEVCVPIFQTDCEAEDVEKGLVINQQEECYQVSNLSSQVFIPVNYDLIVYSCILYVCQCHTPFAIRYFLPKASSDQMVEI
jgi:hypothetical protein